MAPRGKKRNESESHEEGLSKEDEAIAKYIRFNTPTQSTLFQGNEVHYFTGSKAVDTLYESKYGTKAKSEPRFPERKDAVRFLETLMESQLFWRARKLVPKKKEDKVKAVKAVEIDSNNSPRPKKGKKKDETEGDTAADTETEDTKKEKKEDDKEKKKKKVKLEVHAGQTFNDDKDVYVWVYDPTPLYKKVIGMLMVVGTIAACMFPLWPMWLRQGIYYLSIGGIGFFVAIVVVAILRTILFGLIWLFTGGRHHLWVLPNLTEDCGFFESFKPFYSYEYCGGGDAKPKNKKDGKKKKAKDSDDEEEDDVPEKEAEKDTEKDVKEKRKKESDAEKESETVEELLVDEDIDEEEEQEGEQSSSISGSEGEGDSPVAVEPSDKKVRRRVRRADDDFVVVGK